MLEGEHRAEVGEESPGAPAESSQHLSASARDVLGSPEQRGSPEPRGSGRGRWQQSLLLAAAGM